MNCPPIYDANAYFVINTAIVDSIAADTVAPHILTVEQVNDIMFKNWTDSVYCAYVSAEDTAGSIVGVLPEPLPPAYAHSTPLAALAACMLFILGVSAGSLHRAFNAYWTNLVSVRRRANVFDDIHKAPLRAAVALALAFVVFGGIVLYSLTLVSTVPTFTGAFVCMLMMGVYYLFQLCAYSIVGYAFASSDGRRMWVEGFCSSQAFAGILLVVPALLLLFVPSWKTPLLYIALAIYILARIVFIWKGIRIFFTGVRSLLYFILYLCTLEIIPLSVVYTAACRLSGFSVF